MTADECKKLADEKTIENYGLIKRREQFQMEIQRLSQIILNNDNDINELRQKEKQIPVATSAAPQHPIDGE